MIRVRLFQRLVIMMTKIMQIKKCGQADDTPVEKCVLTIKTQGDRL